MVDKVEINLINTIKYLIYNNKILDPGSKIS